MKLKAIFNFTKVRGMKRSLFVLSVLVTLTSFTTGACSSDDDTTDAPKTGDTGAVPSAEDVAPVATDYAKLVAKSYDDTLAEAKKLQAAVDTFVGTPSEANLEACKTAWIAARKIYGQTEGYRFYDGPIEENEGQINGWPLDEAYIDYTRASKEEAIQSTGLVNNTTSLATVTKEAIVGENEKDGEKNLSAGWHAVEFLLWGQDFNADGPGNRSFTDFTATPTDPAVKNGDRRAQYLKAVTDQLVDDLEAVAKAWDLDDAESYGAKFAAKEPKEALDRMFQGITFLAGFELASERLNLAYEAGDQEEEHSCFSDTTTNDVVANFESIENVYLGKFGDFSGIGLTVLVKAANPDVDADVRAKLEAARAAVEGIPAPFDTAILKDSPNREKVKTAVDALTALGESLVAAAKSVGATATTEEEE